MREKAKQRRGARVRKEQCPISEMRVHCPNSKKSEWGEETGCGGARVRLCSQGEAASGWILSISKPVEALNREVT